MNYIHREDYEQYTEDIEPGEQIHVDHDNCTAGSDTRRRLYIKRTDDGRRILAYCHNCGLSGGFNKTNIRAISNKENAEQCSAQHKGVCKVDFDPREAEGQPDSWGYKGTVGRVWIRRYGITDQEVSKYRLGWDDERGLILPVYHGDKLQGFQSRSFDPNKPKYKTTVLLPPLWWYGAPNNEDILGLQSSKLILTEDILSGIKCSRFGAAIALLGTHLHNEVLKFILSKQIKQVIIFLDDDNHQVKANQLKIKRKLEQVGIQATIIKGMNKDPKECSNKELQEIICG